METESTYSNEPPEWSLELAEILAEGVEAWLRAALTEAIDPILHEGGGDGGD
jgi:hypothetical protein